MSRFSIFLNKANVKHGDKYDYSLTEYVNSQTKVKIICPEHGVFEQTPNSHLMTGGCRLCGVQVRAEKKKVSVQDGVNRAKNTHGDKYDYSLVEYELIQNKVEIICPEHGVFKQGMLQHINGSGCPKCGSIRSGESKKNNVQLYINKSREKHGDKYDYSKVKYTKASEKVEIICPEHGVFLQPLERHSLGNGCPRCGLDSRASKRRLSSHDFLTRAKNTHGDKYDYSTMTYVNNHTRVSILCPEHGVFWQKPNDHIDGHGCTECGRIATADGVRDSVFDFIKKANNVHKSTYDYSLVDYKGSFQPVTILCPEHGSFKQKPRDHLRGNGCQKCGNRLSKAEDTICKTLDEYGVQYVQGDRTVIKPLELDIYIPSKKIAIEYNGLIWHSEKYGKDCSYHKSKTDTCKEKGVRLIHIWEDDFNSNPDRELNFILHQLGLTKSEKVYARKTTVVRDIPKAKVKNFLHENHVQGNVNHSLLIGLEHNGELVALGCFTKRGGKHELVRYTTSKTVVGGLSKVMKAFGSECYTFCDNARFTGESYEKAGFMKTTDLKPDYSYLVNGERQHKFLWRRKAIANKLPHVYSDDLTEKQMMELADLPRIWDCGKTRFEYSPS